jgi:site-specific recombinase XerD
MATTHAVTGLLSVISEPSELRPGDRVRLYLESARARNTVRGYRSSFNQFRAWCASAELQTLPAAPETIALYLGANAGRLKASTLEHHLSAIAKAHKAARDTIRRSGRTC